MTKRLTKLVAVVVLVAMLLTTLAACGEKKEPVATVTYNSTTAVMPSNWNEFTYADNNDTQILSYISSSFFTYDYKFENDVKYNVHFFPHSWFILAMAFIQPSRILKKHLPGNSIQSRVTQT